jgi:hypothetical protein
MSKQTAVEWLIQSIVEDQTIKAKSMSEWNMVFDQAKAMEREQIIIAFCEGYDHDGESYDDAETSYYNRTYKGGEQ